MPFLGSPILDQTKTWSTGETDDLGKYLSTDVYKINKISEIWIFLPES